MRQLRLIMLFLLLPVMAAAQDDDGTYLEGLIEDALTGAGREVRVIGFAGALSSSATLETMTIADAKGVWLTLNDAELVWRRAALLRGRLEVDTLSAQSLTITRLPVTDVPEAAETGFTLPDLPAPEATQFALPDLPVSVALGELSVASVLIGEAVFGIPVEARIAGSANLADGEGAVTLTAARIDDRQGALTLEGQFDNSTEALQFDLSLSEEAGGILVTLSDMPDLPSIALDVTGNGTLGDIATQIALATNGQERFGGDVVFATQATDDGATEQSFTARLDGDIRPLLKPDYHVFLGDDLTLDISALRSATGGLDIDRIALGSDALNLAGNMALGPDGWPLRLDLRGAITSPAGDSVLLPIAGPETRVMGAGVALDYDVAQGDAWAMTLAATGLTREGFALERLRLKGAGSLTPGNGDAVGQADGRVTLSVSGLDPGDPDLAKAIGSRLRGSLRFQLREDAPFELSLIDVAGDDYALTGDMQIAVPEDRASPRIAGDVGLDARDITRFAPLAGQALGGGVTVRVSGAMTPLDGLFDAEVTGTTRDLTVGLARIDPLIAGTGQLTLSARRDGTGTVIDSARITTPQSQITARASIATGITEAELDARLNDAGLIHPDMSGPATVQMVLDRTGQRWNADLQATGPGQVALSAQLRTPEGTVTPRLTADLKAATIAPFSWIAARPLGGSVDLRIDGSANLDTLAGQARVDGAITNITAGISQVDTLLRGTAPLRLAVRRDAEGNLVVDDLSLIAQRLIVDASGAVRSDRPRFRFAVDLPNLGVLVPDLPGAFASEGVVMTTGGDWQVDTVLRGPGGLQVQVAGTLAPDASRANLDIDGSAPLALANRQLSPNIASGQVAFDLGLRGPLALNALSGTVSTAGARLSVPQARLTLNDITSTVRLSGGRAQVNATLAPSAGGQVRVSGPVTLSAPFNGDLSIALAALGISRPGLVETAANGTVTVRGPLTGGAQIGGTITFDEVAVQVPSTSGAESAAIPGLRHVGEPAAVRRTRSRAGLIDTGGATGAGSGRRPFGLDLTISAPQRIFIRGRGLDAEMGGTLRLRGTTNALVPSGQFELIRGRLSILGQRLDLTEGFIQPQGELDPFMRIVADASADEIDVRFIIEGPISAPELTITSSPELPQDEILAQFLFGRDLSSVSALQALQIASSIAVLSGRSAGGLSRLREGLGVDDLDIGTTETGETSVRAGKYLSDNVYSDVARTTDGDTEINLNLNLSPSVTLRGTARSDSSTGIGIFIERDY